MLEFEVDVGGNDVCTVVTVRGELDIATAPQLVAALEQVAQRPPQRVVVNLLDTSFIDSTGLATLFQAHKDLQDSGKSALSVVCGPHNTEVRRVIDLMGFDRIFTIHSTLAAAGCDAERA